MWKSETFLSLEKYFVKSIVNTYFENETISRIFYCQIKEILTLFWQKFRESNVFTKETAL